MTKENKMCARTNITIVIIAVLFTAMVSVATVSAVPNLPALPAQNAIKQAIADGNFSVDDIEGKPEYSIKILEQNETHIKFKANTRIIFKNPRGAGFGNNKWPIFKINKTEGNIKAGNYDQRIKDSILSDIKNIKDEAERSKKLKAWNNYDFENGSRIYEFSEVYEATYPNESALESAFRKILPANNISPNNIYNNYVLMGFTNNVHWTYSRQENLYVKIIFWQVLIAWAKVDAVLDAVLGLRLPTIVSLNMPNTMVRGQSYTLNTNINGQDWDAAKYSAANVPSENGNEFVARGQGSITIQAWARIIGDIGPYSLYNKGFDYSRSFQTPFGPYQEFPIPDLYLSPDQTGLKVYCCLNLLWGGIGLKIDPNLGSDKITANWNTRGDAIGSGSMEYNMPNTNYYFGPVTANDYSTTTDYANIRLSDYKYYFTICGLTLGANLQGGLTFLSLNIQTGYIDFYKYDCSDITGSRYLGTHPGTTANSVNGASLVVFSDNIPPGSITNLRSVISPNYIKWSWTDPTDPDFAKVQVYINGKWKADIPKGRQYYDAAELLVDESYEISTRTVDTYGNINQTWVNKPTRTQNTRKLYDNFDDNLIDTSKWSIFTSGYGPIVKETNNRLEIELPYNSYETGGGLFGGRYTSKCKLKGDFDIQTDYQLLTWPNYNGVRMGLKPPLGSVERTSFSSVEGSRELYLANFGIIPSGLTDTTDTSGKLRMARWGNKIGGYYYSNGWKELDKNTTSTADTLIRLSTWSHDWTFSDRTVKLAFDNFYINYGQLVCPSTI